MKFNKLALLSLPSLLLCSCGPVSSFKATILVTTNHTNTCSMSFDEFDGTYVFKVKKINPGEGTISYTASLEEGTINVSYIDALTKDEQHLFMLSNGDSISGNNGYIEKGYRVKIVIRSVGKAKNGKFTFDLN